ncbi:Ig-like domain-containing protein [Archangium sp.]|jgi:hypothetical protein|uniref:Ig-like domain-containing protein n=1 Tax=Archangium sp. TaxID=1872627 RepID=UPI002EDA233A
MSRIHTLLMRAFAPHARLAVAALSLSIVACSPASPPSAQSPSKSRQALTSTLFSYGFESGLGAFTATTTSGTATWHTVTTQQTLAVSSALNPFAVTLADTGEHLPAAGGSSVVWFGDNSTGTFIGDPYPEQSPKQGGTSSQVQDGNLTSPPISLSGVAQAQLEFDSWWEIEGTAAAAYDLMQVWLSSDGGAYTLLGQLNPSFAAQQPADAAYSSGGPAAPPVWRHYAYDISAYAGTSVQIQFRFSSKDTKYNAFRGFTIDNVSVVGGTALPAPTISAVSPSSGTKDDLVTLQGANFQQGAGFYLGSTQIPASSITQFGANSMIFKVPWVVEGTYDVKVVNPDGQTFTLGNGFTYSTTSSPSITEINPATATVGASQHVTISGSNFVSGATVSLGSTAATSVTVVSQSQITATVPGLGAGTYNILVTNPTGQSGMKFAAYTVSDTSTITVTAPNGGESWVAGSTRNITWNSSGTPDVDIDLYKGGGFVAAIASGTAASGGTYAWKIPANLVAGSDYRVRISRPGGTVKDSSDEDFSIGVPNIATTTTVSSSVNPSAQGQEVTFTATIAPVPSSGTVQFQIDGVSFGGPIAVSGGVATSMATSSLASGQHSIVATYSGATPYVTSSGSMTHTVNTAPVANADTISTDEDTAALVTLTAVDTELDELTFAIIHPPAHGTLTLSGAEVLYSPMADYHGTDSFTFKANDGQVDSAVKSISINVVSVNDAPSATAMSASTEEDVQLELALAGHDADNDALTFIVERQPAFGTLSGNPPNVIYTPNADYLGEDSFTFHAHDGQVRSESSVVSITVGSVNDAPVAETTQIHTNEDTGVAVPVIAADVDGDALTYTLLTRPEHGTLSGTAPHFTYTPSEHFHGTDTFTFRVNDGQADSNVARVALVISSVDDVPVAAPQQVSLSEDVASELRLHGSDVEGAELTYAIINPPRHGTLSGTAPNLIYRPWADYTGADTFTFKVMAGGADSAPAEVAINVEPVDDELSGGGVGCSSTGASAAPFSALLMVAVAFFCRRRAVQAAAVAVAVVLPGVAEAQNHLPIIEVEALRINASGADGLVSEAGLLLDPGTYRFGFAAHYEYEPLVYSRNGERAGAILKERLTTHLTAAWAPLSWLEISAQLPAVLHQGGDNLTAYGIGTPQSTVLGTPMLQLRASSCQQRRGSMLDVSSRMGVQLPVGGAFSLARESGVGLMPQVSMGRKVNGWLRVGGEVGLVLRPDATFDGSRLGRSTFEMALLAHTTGKGLRGEVSWRGTFSINSGRSGSEFLGGFRMPVTRKLEAFGVAGLGLGQSLGTPAFRAFMGMAMTLGNEPAAAAVEPVEPAKLELPLPTLALGGEPVAERVREQ